MNSFPQKWFACELEMLDAIRVQLIGKDPNYQNAYLVKLPDGEIKTAWPSELFDIEIDAINKLRIEIESSIRAHSKRLDQLRDALEVRLPKRMALARINAALDPEDEDDEDESTPLETGEPVGEVTK